MPDVGDPGQRPSVASLSRGDRHKLDRLYGPDAPAFDRAALRVYFPYQLDYRGRVYAMPAPLNPQGDDVARALLDYLQGELPRHFAGPWVDANYLAEVLEGRIKAVVTAAHRVRVWLRDVATRLARRHCRGAAWVLSRVSRSSRTTGSRSIGSPGRTGVRGASANSPCG